MQKNNRTNTDLYAITNPDFNRTCEAFTKCGAKKKTMTAQLTTLTLTLT